MDPSSLSLSLFLSLSQEEELQVQMELVEKLTLQLHELEDSLEVSQQESNTLKKQVLCSPLPPLLLPSSPLSFSPPPPLLLPFSPMYSSHCLATQDFTGLPPSIQQHVPIWQCILILFLHSSLCFFLLSPFPLSLSSSVKKMHTITTHPSPPPSLPPPDCYHRAGDGQLSGGGS